MRLFELDQGVARSALSVLQGLANRDRVHVTLNFGAVVNLLKPFGLGINSPEGLKSLKNKIDPAGDVILDVLDNGSVILNTKKENPNKDKAMDTKSSSPTVDKMASNASKKLKPDF